MRGALAAADAPADLVRLGQAEQVGAIDDQGVRLRDVEARLDDRRRAEHVVIAAQELEHDLLELPVAHLPVGHADAHLGHEPAQLLGRLVDRLDPVVQEERLPATLVLAPDRLGDQLLVPLPHVRADRLAIGGRGRDHGDVAQARERHVQRARDRRRRQREHVDLEPQRAQELLLGHAEALLLVDDHEPERLRHDVAREHAMRADQHVDLALGVVGEHALAPRPRCACARRARCAAGSRGSDRGRSAGAAGRARSSAPAPAPGARRSRP